MTRPHRIEASGEPLRVRAASAADAPAIALRWADNDALHARLAPRFFSSAPSAPARLAEAERGIRAALAAASRGSEALLLAERAGAVVGFAHVVVAETPPAPGLRKRRRARLDAIEVAPSERRRGVGGALVSAVEAWARARGAEQLVLTVWTPNRRAASLYRALGYREVSRALARDL